MGSIDSRQWSEWMAFDRIHPPDLWPSTIARLLYRLVCSWTTGRAPKFADFLPPSMARAPVEPMDERGILAAFGIRSDS